uniref:Peroxiredoxin-like 2A n=1 Tax=Panagrellus redivivus TaxID=6233 RepID=A0A7E4VIQ2_PANRE
MLEAFLSMVGSYLGYGAVSAVLGAVFYANLPTKFTLGGVAPTVSYLAAAKLIKIETEKDILKGKQIIAKDLFDAKPTLVMAVRRPGCTFCRKEAKDLSQIKDKLDAAGVQLVGVVHETKGVDDFKPFLAGDVYFDSERRFYGPKERWMPVWMGFLRISTYLRARQTRDTPGNFEGEGRLLGGVYLIDKERLIYSHLERTWGDPANIDEIVEALKKV